MTYVKNCWYMAGWEQELDKSGLLARTLIDEPLVFFRRMDGEVAALLDRCPHRGVPLSLGTTCDGRVRCAYHGLEFDSTGACVRNPHIPGDPGRLRTASFATARKFGAIWLWNGDPSVADPAKIPDFSFLDRPGYKVVHGLMPIQADYRLLIDNLLDLSHTEYIHRNTVGVPGAAAAAKTTVTVGDDEVTVHRRIRGLPPSAFFSQVWSKTPTVDLYSDMTWMAPSSLKLNLSLTEPREADDIHKPPPEEFHFPIANLLTPQSRGSTLYFYAVARNVKIDDEQLTQKVVNAFVQTFEGEDRPILEAIQQRMNEDTTGKYRFADFTIGDGAAKRARRMIDALIGGT